jgi:phosphotriesterase-related protein
MPVVVPTGIYREPWIPPWAQEASEDELYEWMLKELTDEIDDTGVRAAWIKLSAGDDGITDIEKKILRAAARAGMETNALIGSHTIKGRVVNDQLDIIEEVGYTPERFLWIHTQAEPDVDLRLEIAARGAWLEFDALGSKNGPTDDDYLKFIRQIFNAQYAEKLLLSHDQGWHDLDAENVFTYLPELFIPQMRSAGFSQRDIHQLTHVNPFNAFAR